MRVYTVICISLIVEIKSNEIVCINQINEIRLVVLAAVCRVLLSREI
jgi:hypothetical protein